MPVFEAIDIAGVRIGHAHDMRIGTGVTAIVFDEPAVASADIRGGGPGERELALLDPVNTVERIDAIALSGGSAFGLEAGAGVMAWLASQGRGFAVGTARIPIVPGAILFDMLNGGYKNWGTTPPYRDLGYAAADAAVTQVALGSVGAGYGATTATLKGGFGIAQATAATGHRVLALAAVNAIGSVTIGDGPHFWAAPYEEGDEFGGLGWPQALSPDMRAPRLKGGLAARAAENTTLAAIVTDATLTKTDAKRLAIMAQAGMARAIDPVHAPLDGDIVFAAATGTREKPSAVELTLIGATAAHALSRAIARGVYEATALLYPDAQPSWRNRFG